MYQVCWIRKRCTVSPGDWFVWVPHADQDVSVSEDEQQYVVLRHIVEICVFLIGKKKVWFPQTLEHVGVNSEGVALKISRKSEARVVPSLTEKYVHSVVLGRDGSMSPSPLLSATPTATCTSTTFTKICTSLVIIGLRSHTVEWRKACSTFLVSPWWFPGWTRSC